MLPSVPSPKSPTQLAPVLVAYFVVHLFCDQSLHFMTNVLLGHMQEYLQAFHFINFLAPLLSITAVIALI